MNTLVQTAPLMERHESQSKTMSGKWQMVLPAIGLLLAAGYAASTQKFFKPGDEIGYNLGLVGGLMMLVLLLYPLRKRFSFMKGLGILPQWFKLHMVFGILGPTLILFHATFQIGSINAGIALVCMLLVAGSGIFGRFFYTKIHHGLYGKHASMKELQTALTPAGEIRSIFSFAPEIQQNLDHFQARHSTTQLKDRQLGIRNFIRAGFAAKRLSHTLTKDLHRAMYAKAHEGKWNDAQMKRVDALFLEYNETLQSYLVATRDVAQFHTYERLFSLWHIFHIPLVYMMVFASVWHVTAVHMY